MQTTYVLQQFVDLSEQLQCTQLKGIVITKALEGLQLCEAHARACIAVLIEVLKTSNQLAEEVVLEAVWMLHTLVRRCSPTRPWVQESGALQLLVLVMRKYIKNANLCLCGAWIMYDCAKYQGLMELLSHEADPQAAGNGSLAGGIVAAVSWVVYEVIEKEGGYFERGEQATVERATMLRLIASKWATHMQDAEVRGASASAVDALLQAQPELTGLFIDLKGPTIVVEALRLSTDVNKWTNDTVRSCSRTLSLLAKGSTQQLRIMHECGTCEALYRLSTRGAGNQAEEMAMYALGQLAGLAGVMKTMTEASTSPAVIRGSLDYITEMAGELSEPSDITLLPVILEGLLRLKQQSDMAVAGEAGPGVVKCRRRCVAAMSSVLTVLASHIQPGQHATVEQAVATLRTVLQNTSVDSEEEPETAAEGLGRMALASQAWRQALLKQGVVETLSSRIPLLISDRRLLKYFFWSAAAFAGLDWVMAELQRSVQSADIADAAFCTVIDILDSDVEGEWALSAAQQGAEAAQSQLLQLVAETTHLHANDSNLQFRGCKCIAHLFQHTAPGAGYQQGLNSILRALQRHRDNTGVVREGYFALRTSLEGQAAETIENFLRQEGMAKLAQQTMIDFADCDAELTEHVVFVLAAVAGIDASLKALMDVRQHAARTSGSKGLFEFCRQRPGLMTAEDRTMILCRANEMVASRPGDEVLRQNAALLVGICGAG